MNRRTLLTGLAVIGAGGPSVASAQGAPRNPLVGAPPGEPVTLYSSAGDGIAQVRVVDLVDPFNDFGPFFVARPDSRAVAVTIEVRNTGSRPFAMQTYQVEMVDVLGRRFTPMSSLRSDRAISDVPDLEDEAMLPGETVTGVLAYSVLKETALAGIVYSFVDEVRHIYTLVSFAS